VAESEDLRGKRGVSSFGGERGRGKVGKKVGVGNRSAPRKSSETRRGRIRCTKAIEGTAFQSSGKGLQLSAQRRTHREVGKAGEICSLGEPLIKKEA